jgi:AP2-like factor, ANT lineage
MHARTTCAWTIHRAKAKRRIGVFLVGTQEEAAEAYDIAAIKFRGLNAVTNFDMSRYDVKSILESSALPIGSAAKRLKETEAALSFDYDFDRIVSQAYGVHYHHVAAAAWPTIAAQASSLYHPYPQPLRGWCKQEQDVIAAAHNLCRSSTT